MDDELENFLKDQRAKVAKDKANLKQDLPYMEIRAKDHKSHGRTIKENIPPFKRSTVLGKEDGQCLSLPLGEDYERKKQKLQQELRLDYNRYMAQKKHFDAGEPGRYLPLTEKRNAKEHFASLRPPLRLDSQHSPRPPSRRDATTLTEGRRGVHRGRRLAEGRGPWVEENGLLPRESRATRLGRVEPVDGDSEDDYSEEELELMERRRLQDTGLQMVHAERRPRHYYKTDSRLRDRRIQPHHGQRLSHKNRERKEAVRNFFRDLEPIYMVTTGTRVGGTSRSPTNRDDAEFATGLMIGAADEEVALQRRKERYRRELQEQIAEQQRSKKREKELDLRVAVPGATDTEKQTHRMKHFGPSNVGKQREGLYQAGLDLDVAPPLEESSVRPSDDKRFVDRERLPPEQPRVAFQSPLLEYSSALGLGSDGLSPCSQAGGFPRGMDTPRMPGFPSHPATTLAEAYRTPFDEAYSYYGTRNSLEPNLPFYGQMTMTGGAPMMSFLTLPQTGGGCPSQRSLHSPQHGPPEPPAPPQEAPRSHRPNSDAATVSSGISVFPAEKVVPSKESAISYKEALKQQIQERQERRRLEREERDRFEAKLEADMKTRDPWGRGGGGAPLRDSRGNLITDLHQMHKLNEEAYINPETRQRRASASVTVPSEDLPLPSSRGSGFAYVQTPKYARGSVFANQPTPHQLMEQDKYKSFLKQQIEEKRRKEAEEREQMRLEEEKEERRLAEQRARIQREYEEEQERKKRKEMEQKAKNEELVRLAEERRNEVERKKKEAEEKENAALRRQYEKERQACLDEVHREPSPPIPTLQKRHRPPKYTPRPPTMDNKCSTGPMSECSLAGHQSPPVPARRNQLRAAEDQRGVISELSALRQQLRSEQKRLESQLLQSEWEELDSRLSDRHRERPQVDVFDMARLRLQAPVRRPPSKNREPLNLLRIRDSLQLRFPESEYRGGGYSEVPGERGESGDIQRQAEHREQHRRTTRPRRSPAHDYFDPSPTQQPNHYSRDPMRGYLLESESAFIDPLGDTYPVPPTPEQKTPQLSARERRRLAKRTERHKQSGASREPIGQPDNYFLQSENRLTSEQVRERGRHGRTRRLQAPSRHGRRTGDLSDDGDDDDEDAADEGSPEISPRGLGRHSSVDSPELWMRPESSETLKRLMTGPSRKERLPGQDMNTQDWDGPSTYHG